MPTTDPRTGYKGTTTIDFQDYANLPRNDQGFIDNTSSTARALNLDVQRPADYGTQAGYELEDALYFGEDSYRDRMNADPTFVERALRMTTPGQILGNIADYNEQAIYNELVQGPNYRGTPMIGEQGIMGTGIGAGFGQNMSLNQDAARYVAVMDNGQVVGSLAVDAAGNPVGYRGARSNTAVPQDPAIDQVAAQRMISGGLGDLDQGGDDEVNQDAGGPSLPGQDQPDATTPECPAGYIYDETSQSCVMDPFQQQFEVGAPYSGPFEIGGQYTQMPMVQTPTLQPVASPSFNIPQPVVRPITIAPQTPTGLASLNPNNP